MRTGKGRSLNQKTLLVLLTILLAFIFTTSYLSPLQTKYLNEEYQYSFKHPNSAKIIFISSLVNSADVQHADTISVEFKTGKILRIQVFTPDAVTPSNLCSVSIKQTRGQICFSSPNSNNLLEENEFLKLIKTIEF